MAMIRQITTMQKTLSILIVTIILSLILSFLIFPVPPSLEWILPVYFILLCFGMYFYVRYSNETVLDREHLYKILLEKSNTSIFRLDIKTLNYRYIAGAIENMAILGMYNGIESNISNIFTEDSCKLIKDTIKIKTAEWERNSVEMPFGSIDCQLLDIFGNQLWVSLDMCFINSNGILSEIIISQRYINLRKQEELRILNENDTLNNLCNNIDECLWIADFQTLSIKYINKNSFKIFGLSADNVLNKNLTELIHKDVYEQLLKILSNKIKEYKHGIVTEIKDTFVTKIFNVLHGQYLEVEISVSMSMDINGNFKDIIGVTKLNDKLHIDKESQTRLDLLDLINKNVSDNIFILDYNTKTYKYLSSSFYKLTGVANESAIGDNFKKYLSKQSYAEIVDLFAQELTKYRDNQIKEVVVNTKAEIIHINGKLINCEVNLVGNVTADNNIDYVVGVARLENEISLDNNLELQKVTNITESALDIIWSMNVKTMRYTFVSNAVLSVLGYVPEEMVGELFTEFVSKDTAENFHNLLHRKLEEATNKSERPNINCEIQMHHKLGYTVWVELLITNLRGNSSNNCFEIVGTTKRIDERKNTELLIFKQQAELQILADKRDKFFEVIGHDIKNPVSALMNTAELLSENYENMNGVMIKKQMDMITESADHLYRLMDNLLQWSKHTVGEIPYRPNKCNIADIIMTATDHLKQQAQYKDITLNYKFETFGNNGVICDENMIRTVIINLVSNAIKYSHFNNSVDILIRLYEKDKRFLEFIVQDYGIGMNTERLQKLFVFEKNKSIAGTNNEPGAGLGLILCKEFINKHNTFIWVESELGRGSAFHFTLLKV